MYHDRDTFDFSQGHVIKNQPTAVPVFSTSVVNKPCTYSFIVRSHEYVLTSCKTAFISYHVMSAKTRVLKRCCLLFDWTEFWKSSALLSRELWLAYDDFREDMTWSR